MKIIGISVETTNQNNQAMQDIGAMWEGFMNENIAARIPNSTGAEIYSVYFDYESDHTGKYTNMIGLRVSSLNEIPAGMIGKSFPAHEMQKFTAKGKIPMSIYQTWQQIWADQNLKRAFLYDYEILGEKSQGEHAEVDIFISVK
ncbi:MAG: GyrI-like domain-containing protein [Bacteroidota bacterium]